MGFSVLVMFAGLITAVPGRRRLRSGTAGSSWRIGVLSAGGQLRHAKAASCPWLASVAPVAMPIGGVPPAIQRTRPSRRRIVRVDSRAASEVRRCGRDTSLAAQRQRRGTVGDITAVRRMAFVVALVVNVLVRIGESLVIAPPQMCCRPAEMRPAVVDQAMPGRCTDFTSAAGRAGDSRDEENHMADKIIRSHRARTNRRSTRRRRRRPRPAAGSAARWSTTTSSSTPRPPRWSSRPCSSRRTTPQVGHRRVVRDVRRRLRRPADRCLRPRSLGRHARPEERARALHAADRRLHLLRRRCCPPMPRSASGRRSCWSSCG